MVFDMREASTHSTSHKSNSVSAMLKRRKSKGLHDHGVVFMALQIVGLDAGQLGEIVLR